MGINAFPPFLFPDRRCMRRRRRCPRNSQNAAVQLHSPALHGSRRLRNIGQAEGIPQPLHVLLLHQTCESLWLTLHSRTPHHAPAFSL